MDASLDQRLLKLELIVEGPHDPDWKPAVQSEVQPEVDSNSSITTEV